MGMPQDNREIAIIKKLRSMIIEPEPGRDGKSREYRP
ncbi:hypothetical protein GGI1_22119 [Acidithiobacillus sp. GGI-221]|nr:hypothetical protein GGI1_22119 [Acidithiobacillus sp. GGI-221]